VNTFILEFDGDSSHHDCIHAVNSTELAVLTRMTARVFLCASLPRVDHTSGDDRRPNERSLQHHFELIASSKTTSPLCRRPEELP